MPDLILIRKEWKYFIRYFCCNNLLLNGINKWNEIISDFADKENLKYNICNLEYTKCACREIKFNFLFNFAVFFSVANTKHIIGRIS